MSIYTDNDRRLCCPLCGGARVQLTAVRQTTSGALGVGVALLGRCEECAGQYEFTFRSISDGTRVTVLTLAGSARDLDAVRAAQLNETERTA